MRAALVVHRIRATPEGTLSGMLDAVARAASSGAGLVLFPEASLTGFRITGDERHDLALGAAADSPELRKLSAAAREHGVHVGLGYLEREGGGLYDSAVLFDTRGAPVLRYRRIDRRWHDPDSDPAVYREGDRLASAPLPAGRTVFLLCGDLFNDCVVRRARELRPDLVLVPFARSSPEPEFDPEWWRVEEAPAYSAQAGRLGCRVLLVNALDGGKPHPFFGGALAVDESGHILAALDPGAPGLLLVDL
jgi:predicted amidohydrolase